MREDNKFVTTKLLKIVPDKIQVLITELEKENWGKAGSTVIDFNFADKSRVINWDTRVLPYTR